MKSSQQEIKIGDLVRMKPKMFWILKGHSSRRYTETPLLVLETAYNAVKLLHPGGLVKSDLKENYKVVQKACL